MSKAVSKRLERPIKQYCINQCALYGIKGKSQLLKALKWSGDVDSLLKIAQCYTIWNTDGGRNVQAATAELRVVHSRIATLLRRISMPNYRHSGIRKRSFVTNAAEHIAPFASIKLDVKSYYPSTTFYHIKSFFLDQMNCAADVAEILACVCSFDKKHIPTGGVHSEVLAFFCHKPMFDEMALRVSKRLGTMTVYVDDIVITMPNASLTDLEWVRKLFIRNKLTLHSGKSRVLRKCDEKIITGVSISNGIMTAPKKQHLKLHLQQKNLREAKSDSEASTAARSVVGHLDHFAQINSRFREKATGTRSRLQSLLA